jgi:hypothetical protein
MTGNADGDIDRRSMGRHTHTSLAEEQLCRCWVGIDHTETFVRHSCCVATHVAANAHPPFAMTVRPQ